MSSTKSFDYYFIRGDSQPPLCAYLEIDDAPFDPSVGGGVVSIVVRERGSSFAVEEVAQLINPATGEVKSNFDIGNRLDPGPYDVSWVVDYGTGARLSFPGRKWLTLEVRDSLRSLSLEFAASTATAIVGALSVSGDIGWAP